MRDRDDRVPEQALGDGAIDRDLFGAGARQFASLAVSGGLTREECRAINRIVGDAAWDALGAQGADETVARQAEDRLVDKKNKSVDCFARDSWIACDRRQTVDGAEAFAQEGGGAALVLDLFGQACELREQNSALPFRHPVVRAHQRAFEIVIGTAASAIYQRLASLLEVRIVGRDHSAFARGHRLRGLKAEASERAVRADAAVAELSAGDVRAILDDRNGMRARNFSERIEVGERRAVMHRDDRLGAARDESLDGFRIDACVGGADIGEDRTRHACDGGIGRRRKRDCRHDHLVAGADTERFERDLERAGARCRRDREASALICGEGCGELAGLAIGARIATPTRRVEDVVELGASRASKTGHLEKGRVRRGWPPRIARAEGIVDLKLNYRFRFVSGEPTP